MSQGASGKRLPLLLAAWAVGMFGFGFGLVQLYDLFCRVTGLGGGSYVTLVEPQVLARVESELGRQIKVRMITHKGRGVQMTLEPLEDSIEVRTGQRHTVRYRLTNHTNRPQMARAVPSLAPAQLAPYFHKVACFCFDAMPIGPREEREMTMTFVVDGELPQGYGDDILVGYTLFVEKTAGRSGRALSGG